MYQQEIQFFWPLTEQIPLELDFTECDTRRTVASRVDTCYNVTFGFGQGALTTTVINTSGIEIKSGTITIKDDKMPWYRKVMFKLMGFKW